MENDGYSLVDPWKTCVLASPPKILEMADRFFYSGLRKDRIMVR
jgi:hypothetical protein